MQHPHIRGLTEWRPLARGGLAMIWQARQTAQNRLVAVKVYQRTLGDDGRRRFVQEVAAVGRLSDHGGIVTAHDAGILPDGRPYLIMEFCPGGCLNKRLESENRPSQEQVLQIGVRIADALAAAHARGVLHRNIKPANILIDSTGKLGLSDFGLPVMAGAGKTAVAALNGTPGYASPEVLRTQPATESGDVFSLGATLYALLTGSPPPRLDVVGAAEAIRHSTGSQPEVDQNLMDVLVTALSSDPTARPTAAEFRDQLVKLAAPETKDRGPLSTADQRGTPAPTPSGSTPRKRGRRRIAVLALAAVLVTVIGSATAWVINEPVSSRVPTATSQSAATTRGEPPASASPSRAVEPTALTRTATPGGGDRTGSSPPAAATISLENSAVSAKPFDTVRISGTYHGGSARLLRVQRQENDSWLSFPIPTKTNHSGRFTTYVELGRPGRYRLRVLDPDSGVTSKTFVLVIRG